jgi:hypothetical protein
LVRVAWLPFQPSLVTVSAPESSNGHVADSAELSTAGGVHVAAPPPSAELQRNLTWPVGGPPLPSRCVGVGEGVGEAEAPGGDVGEGEAAGGGVGVCVAAGVGEASGEPDPPQAPTTRAAAVAIAPIAMRLLGIQGADST